MKLKGKIVAIGEAKTGLSEHVGQWKAQDYVLQFLDGDYERKLMFNVFGESKIESFDLHEGDEVEVFLTFDVDTKKGRIYNNISARFVAKLGQQPTDKQGSTASGDGVGQKPAENESPGDKAPLVADPPKPEPRFTPMNDGPSDDLPF